MLRTSAITRPSRGALLAVAGLFGLVLGGCPTVDLGESPPAPMRCEPDRAYYENEIWPKYLAPAGGGAKSCVAQAGCHNDSNGRSGLRLDTSNPPDHGRNYQVVTRYLLCSTPEESVLLTKPLAASVPHAGGDLIQMDDTEVMVFLGWFP
ncbi:MAG TPA: hypothetical protein VM734_12635 [Kofleriaceae bacterium]|jgi:hypothetical protein|nr:hypothetical protein [Kofleriaceae bacterium]